MLHKWLWTRLCGSKCRFVNYIVQNMEIKYLGTVAFSLASIHTTEILLGLTSSACRKALFLFDPQCPYIDAGH